MPAARVRRTCGDPSWLDEIGKAQTMRIAAIPVSHRSERGQFMTPPAVASLIASLVPRLPASVRLLDPGAGCGALTAAFVAEACHRTVRPREIDVVAFEIEDELVDGLRETLARCSDEAERAGISFHSDVRTEDFVEAATRGRRESLFEACRDDNFTHTILNPPYCKISSNSATRRRLSSVGIEVSNLYAAFVALALRSLATGGELIAITPRSFCNGPYFRPFRRMLLQTSALQHVHVFERRDEAFSADAVLQENVIFRATKGAESRSVTMSVSGGPGRTPRGRRVPYEVVVRSDDLEAFIHLPTGQSDASVADRVRRLPCRLDDLGIAVSTGRVVHFRVREALVEAGTRGAVPLLWSHHVRDGRVEWPREGCRKPQGLLVTDETRGLLVPAGSYVVVKRFSAKEEQRRVTAATVHEGEFDSDGIAMENHLNFFHADGAGVGAEFAKGLAAFLNSEAVDGYFRQFNGHTQVNATDLRSLRYPTRGDLVALGRRAGDTAETTAIEQALVALGI
jgi:adenine-specific DNA-methyltransferase